MTAFSSSSHFCAGQRNRTLEVSLCGLAYILTHQTRHVRVMVMSGTAEAGTDRDERLIVLSHVI